MLWPKQKSTTHKKGQFANFLHLSILPSFDIVFENFVYSVTICFNGEKLFRPTPSTTLENIRAFVHSFRQNEFYVTIMLNVQF